MKYFLLPTLVLLAACNTPSVTMEPGGDEKLARGEVIKVAEAPDGTILWAVEGAAGRIVHFSSHGTSTTQSCGKNCTIDVQVPTTYN